MKKEIIYITLCVALCLLISCHSSSMYFDIEQQAIIGCENPITKLYIISKDNKDYLYFSILHPKKGSNKFNIKKLIKDYSIETTRTCIDLQDFKLRPETEYEIINYSNGDATSGKLLIRTDKNSSVIYADKTSCK